MQSRFYNVGILSLSNAFGFAVTSMMMLIGSLLGAELAPSENWATLPIAIMIIGTACGVIPVTRLMAKLGRKHTLWIFLLLSGSTCLIASYSVAIRSFELFCFCAAMIGVSNAALQQVRFAAMESVSPDKATTAASIVMLSGVAAAFIGPELAVLGRSLTDVDYQGSFWLVAVCSVIAALILTLFTPAPINTNQEAESTRSLREIISNPGLQLAVASALIAYVVMSFIMTGTPVSMHNHHGHSLEDTKWVIQSHIAAMFLPSLVTPLLFNWVGIRGMMLTGLLCYGITIVIGLINSSVMGYWSQLVMLGIGWNFLFIAGTSLLPRTYLPGEQYKAQAFNDSIVFSTQAMASLSAGWAISVSSWQTMLLICLLPIAVMIGMLIRTKPDDIPRP